MPACEECHRVKLRCDNDPLLNGNPCSRCRRLQVECLGRPSRQGQGPKKRQKKASNSNNNHDSEDGHVLEAQLASCASQQVSADGGRHHFGVRYLIHSWTSFAFARRSFALLGRASRLAAKCQIPMDELYCESRREVLDPIMYNKNDTLSTPSSPYNNQRLQWKDIPAALLRTLKATTAKERANRYLVGRQAIHGQSRWFASDLFEQDIASVWLMEETWKANRMTVVKLFLHGSESFDKFTNMINYQISRYSHPGKQPECCRANGFQIKFQQPPLVREMDAIYSFQIVTLENSFYMMEYVPSKAEDETENHTMTTRTAECDTNEKRQRDSQSDDPFERFDNLVPLEAMDQDFEAFLALLND